MTVSNLFSELKKYFPMFFYESFPSYEKTRQMSGFFRLLEGLKTP